ncbi:uncharacterized protein MEPE_06734 [Melanopsichium pennsylvanicum]|uniref:Uncharacterized protein n=1 Tax=Melanopsichium pennsylvanicum TaxID=63383 RepID=A0AAJ4XTA3_9BASI|nr:uncharacterized protein MEPE_06734 [Melanopsichium pennsylvanicum]
MVTSTKFASLVGSLTLAFVLASSLHPVHTAPVAVRRQDAGDSAAAPADYISVAQPQMSEQDIYAMGIPQSDSTPTSSNLDAVLQAAAQAALRVSNQTASIVSSYDATPAPATAPAGGNATSLVANDTVTATKSNADSKMQGNPDEGDLYAQVVGTPAGAPSTAIMQGNPDQGDAYRSIIAGQIEQFGAKARRAFQTTVMETRQLGQLQSESQEVEQAATGGSGMTTTSIATMVPTADAPTATEAATSANDVAATSATDAAATFTTDAAATSTSAATTAVDSGLANVPVAAPVPSDYSSPEAPDTSAALPGSSSTVPSVATGVVSSAVPTAPAAQPSTPAEVASVSAPNGVSSVSAPAGVPSVSVPAGAPSVSANAAVPSVSASVAVTSVSAPVAFPSLNPAAAAAITTMPSSNANAVPTASKSAKDLTMTFTLPTKSLPTQMAGSNKADDDQDGDWKTMTILVPAGAFGGVATNIELPAVSTGAIASSAAAATSSSTSVAVETNSVVISSSSATDASNTASASAKQNVEATSTATPTLPPNLSSFTSMKAETTPGVLTIPLTGVIDGTTYSTMLTLTIPRFGGLTSLNNAVSTTTSISVSATGNAQSAVQTSAAPSKITTAAAVSSSSSSSSASAKAISSASVDPSYISPDDTPPLLKSSMTSSTSTSAPNASPTQSTSANGANVVDDADGDDDCEEYEDDDNDASSMIDAQKTAAPKSLLTKVWDWVTGKPLNERDFNDNYQYVYEERTSDEFYHAQE